MVNMLNFGEKHKPYSNLILINRWKFGKYWIRIVEDDDLKPLINAIYIPKLQIYWKTVIKIKFTEEKNKNMHSAAYYNYFEYQYQTKRTQIFPYIFNLTNQFTTYHTCTWFRYFNLNKTYLLICYFEFALWTFMYVNTLAIMNQS